MAAAQSIIICGQQASYRSRVQCSHPCFTGFAAGVHPMGCCHLSRLSTYPFLLPSAVPCSTLDSAGREVPGASLPHDLPRETAVRMYETMVKLQTVDTIFYEAQRQAGCRASCCVAGFS